MDVAQDEEDVNFARPVADVDPEANKAAVEDVWVSVYVGCFAVSDVHYYGGGVALAWSWC